MDNAKVQNFIDTVEINQILNLYGPALDGFAWDIMDQLFVEDELQTDYSPAGTGWPTLADITYGFNAVENTFNNHKHSMYGSVIEVHGDTASAFTYSDWILVRHEAAKDGDANYWRGHGWYNDTLVRTEKGWRINKRICKMMKYFGNAYVSVSVLDQKPCNDTFRLQNLDKNGEVYVLNDMRAKEGYKPYTAWKEQD